MIQQNYFQIYLAKFLDTLAKTVIFPYIDKKSSIKSLYYSESDVKLYLVRNSQLK